MAKAKGSAEALKRGKPITKENARAMQAAAAKSRKKKNIERRILADEIVKRMGARDWDEVIDGAIARAKDSDKGFEVLRDTLGQKPSDKVTVSTVNDEAMERLSSAIATRRSNG